MSIIYHIARKIDWNHAAVTGTYAAASLASEGFIHCSTAEQVIATADRLFAAQNDLVLLCVDTDRVTAEIRYENLEGGATQFPHVYGALPLASICAAHDFPPRNDGQFGLPPALCPGGR